MAARLLLAAGADPTRASQGNGWTALMFAAEEGHLDLVQLLASFGTDVDAADDGGYTAQDIASREGHMDVEGWRAEVDNWPTFKIAVGCREVAAAKCMLRGGRVDPASCSLVELDLIANTAADKLWAGSPSVSDAKAGWSASRHFLFHAGVRRSVHHVLMVVARLQRQQAAAGGGGSRRSVRQLQYTATAVVLPAEMWLIVCSFLLRGDWGAPRLPDVAPGNMAWA